MGISVGFNNGIIRYYPTATESQSEDSEDYGMPTSLWTGEPENSDLVAMVREWIWIEDCDVPPDVNQIVSDLKQIKAMLV